MLIGNKDDLKQIEFVKSGNKPNKYFDGSTEWYR